MTQEIIVAGEVYHPTGPKTRWQENHGNLLLVFVALVFALGGCILIYRQHRFVAPRFPESKMIAAPSQPANELSMIGGKDSVRIRVVGAANESGNVKIAVYDSDATFNVTENALLSASVVIVDGEATWTIPVPAPEKLSIAAFHDENGDNELNRNRLGIPTERYGFSRNARGLSGTPSFKQTVIDLPKAGETVTIFIR